MSRNPNSPVPPRQPVPPRRAPMPNASNPAARSPAAVGAASVAPPPHPYEPAIVARAGAYYRTTRYIMVLVLIACGGWFGYDGWIGYPAGNAKIKQLERELRQLEPPTPRNQAEYDQKNAERNKLKPHMDLDIKIQKYLGFGLPIAGLLMLLWTLYNSRGVYRYNDQTLEFPGHPPLPLHQITRIDQTLWERKGIAYIEYQTPTAQGRIRLDDFIYQRDPTDAIYEKIEKHFAARQQT